MLEKLLRLVRSKKANEDGEEASFVGEYVDTLNKYGIESTEERVHFKAIVKEYPSLKELLDTAKNVKEFNLEREKEAVIVSGYIDTINQYGLDSKETELHYELIVKEHPSLKQMLDNTNKLKVMFEKRDLP